MIFVFIFYLFFYILHFFIEEFEDTKGVMRIRKSKKNRQHNDQKKKGQPTIYKTYIQN